ncbi:hypothetical protein BH24ACT3_BH24ACT3_10660 [soil metagenome]
MKMRRTGLLLALLLAIGLVAACGDDDDEGGEATEEGTGEEVSEEAADGPTIRLVPQNFAESETLTHVYGQYLEAKGFDVEVQEPSGFREQVYPALEEGSADVVIDYAGSAASYLAPDSEPSADSDETYERLTTALEDTSAEALEYSPAEDANALVVLAEFAEENDLTTISDLAEIDDEVVFGSSAECVEREDCLLGYTDPEIYGFEFANTVVVDYGPPLAEGLLSGELDAVQYQTTAPEIDSGDFVVLEDDEGMLSADNVVPVVRSELLGEYDEELVDAVNELSALLETEDLIGWNVRTDIDKDDPIDVATDWLEEEGLV